MLKELIKQLIFPPTETQECPWRTYAEIVNDLLFKKTVNQDLHVILAQERLIMCRVALGPESPLAGEKQTGPV